MIIDASVAFKWLADEEESDPAFALLDRYELFAPILLMHEVANGLWRKVQRDQIDRSVSFSDELNRLPQLVNLVDETAHVARALEIGREFGHPIYDCVYLAMAEARSDRLVTADLKFMAKVAGSSLGTRFVTLGSAVDDRQP